MNQVWWHRMQQRDNGPPSASAVQARTTLDSAIRPSYDAP